MEPKLPEDGDLQHVRPAAHPSVGDDRSRFPWPWGLVAIGVMALAWVGVYLMWNGMALLLGL